MPGTFRLVPVLAIPPSLATAAIAWRHGNWSGVALVSGLVIAYGAALTSLGLALATWAPTRCVVLPNGSMLPAKGNVIRDFK